MPVGIGGTQSRMRHRPGILTQEMAMCTSITMVITKLRSTLRLTLEYITPSLGDTLEKMGTANRRTFGITG